MIERFGIIQAVEDSRAQVKLFPESKCASCGTCNAGTPIWFDNVVYSASVQPGDRVIVAYESSESALAIGAFIIPPVLFIAVYGVVRYVVQLADLIAILSASVVFCSYLVVFSMRVRKKEKGRIITIRKVEHE